MIIVIIFTIFRSFLFLVLHGCLVLFEDWEDAAHVEGSEQQRQRFRIVCCFFNKTKKKYFRIFVQFNNKTKNIRPGKGNIVMNKGS